MGRPCLQVQGVIKVMFRNGGAVGKRRRGTQGAGWRFGVPSVAQRRKGKQIGCLTAATHGCRCCNPQAGRWDLLAEVAGDTTPARWIQQVV